MKKHKNNKCDNKSLHIPSNIKVLFGKFYVYSTIIFFFLLLYPFIIMQNINMITNVALLLMMPIFYSFLTIEVIRKRETYRSIFFLFWNVLFWVTYVISVVKFIIFA